MKLKLVIVDFEISPRTRKLLMRVGLPIAIVFGGGALAYANVPTVWKSGDPLKAADLNGNFSALDTRISAVEATRTEWAIIGFGCASIVQSSPWMTTVNNGAGDCSIIFKSGTFSGAPTCVAISNGSNGAWPRYAYVVKINSLSGLGAPGSDGVRVRHMVVDTTIGPINGSVTDEPFSLTCIGAPAP